MCPPARPSGEMSLLSGEQHSAQIIALRDSELLRISPGGFEALIARHPRVMLNMMRLLVRRLQDTTKSAKDGARPKDLRGRAAARRAGPRPIAHRLASSLVEMGSKAAVLDATASEQSAEWFNTFEAAHESSSIAATRRARLGRICACRQADRMFLLARADQPLPQQSLAIAKERVSGCRNCCCCIRAARAAAARAFLAEKRPLRIPSSHLRAGRVDDVRRLARFISGRAVGLVLGGGGARGFAHIGVVKALTEAGVPFDYLGGASMGAIIAAGLAAEWSIDELPSACTKPSSPPIRCRISRCL